MIVESRAVGLASGIAIDYVERGDRSGLPLLLLHGYTDSWRSFAPLLDALPTGIRAIALSQRGHGDSDKPHGAYETRLLATDLADFMDQLGIGSAVVAGHSMGSQVAQRFALDYPRRTRGLVLLGAFTTLKGNPAVEALWTEVVAALDDPVDPGFVRAFQQGTLARPVPSAFFETIVAESLKAPAHVWRSALRAQIEEDVGPRLSAVAAPTLVLWGDKDEIGVRAQQESILRTVRGARMVAYAGAGHGLHWEEPRRVASDIAAFLKEIAAPQASARRIA